MSIGSKHYIIPVFIPMQGCSFSCYFCNQHAITGKLRSPDKEEIRNSIENHLATFEKDAFIELAFFGGSFTGLPRAQIAFFLECVYPWVSSGAIHALRISTRPDYIDDEVLEFLKANGVKTIELGAQSMNPEVLKRSGRGHSPQDVSKASASILAQGFTLGLQMMTGLPGDSHESCLQTAKSFVEMGATETRIYPTQVIKGTRLAKMLLEGSYKSPSTEETVELLAELIPVFEDGGVKILRIGLHPTEIHDCDTVMAGPGQHGLRENAMSRLWWNNLHQLLELNGKKLSISVHPSQLNYVSGYRKQNRKRLEEVFQMVNFKADQNLYGREFTYHID